MFLFFFSLSLSHLRGVLRRLHHVPQHARCFGEPPPPVGLVSRGAGHAHRRSGRCLRPRARRRHGGSFLLSFSTNGLIANKKKKNISGKMHFPRSRPRGGCSQPLHAGILLSSSREKRRVEIPYFGDRGNRDCQKHKRGARTTAPGLEGTPTAPPEKEGSPEKTLASGPCCGRAQARPTHPLFFFFFEGWPDAARRRKEEPSSPTHERDGYSRKRRDARRQTSACDRGTGRRQHSNAPQLKSGVGAGANAIPSTSFGTELLARRRRKDKEA